MKLSQLRSSPAVELAREIQKKGLAELSYIGQVGADAAHLIGLCGVVLELRAEIEKLKGLNEELEKAHKEIAALNGE